MSTTVKLSVDTTNGGGQYIEVSATDSGGNPAFNSQQVEELTATLTARVRKMFEGEHGTQHRSTLTLDEQARVALRLLDEARNQDGMSYGVYSELYDAILAIGAQK